MKKKFFLLNLSILIITVFHLLNSQEIETKRRRQKPKPKPAVIAKPIPKAEANPPVLNAEEEKQKDHEKICTILTHCSSIFGNFVQLVKEPSSQENIGEQVGNMAENVFHIVAEATKAKLIEKSDSEIEYLLHYLESDEFKKDLQKIVDEILNEEEKKNQLHKQGKQAC